MPPTDVLRARGRSHELELRPECLIVRPVAVTSSAKQLGRIALAAYSDPTTLFDGIPDSKKRDLLDALLADNDVFVALGRALRQELTDNEGEDDPGDEPPDEDDRAAFVATLMGALRTRRAAVAAAFKKERKVILGALKSKRAVGTVLISDYFPLAGETPTITMEQSTGDQYRAVVTAGDQRVAMLLEAQARADFDAMAAALRDEPGKEPEEGQLEKRLKELARLRDQGLLTEEEFTASKARALGLADG